MIDFITWAWLIGGVLLIILELFVPGLVVCFLGAGALLVAFLRWLGVLTGTVNSFTVWFISSIVLLVGLRHFLLRFLPSDRSFQMTDEDLQAVGSVVEVVESVSSGDQKGRVRFGGTTWPAVSKEGTIPKGKKAKLLLRDNLVWTVEPYDAEELPPSHKESIIKEE
jgi:membrane protein implicated in regulation of membrane protease activity